MPSGRREVSFTCATVSPVEKTGVAIVKPVTGNPVATLMSCTSDAPSVDATFSVIVNEMSFVFARYAAFRE